MKTISNIKDKYIDCKISQWKPNQHKLRKGMLVKWNWMGRFSLGGSKEDRFVVDGIYECGVKTTCGQLISDFWLKRVKPRV